jgi:hypothetical protein
MKNRRWNRAAGAAVCLLLAFALSGCASMSESQCRQADWSARGLADGREGRSAQRLDDHVEACAKIGVAPDRTAWDKGWEQGIRSYCTASSGWREGLRNQTYWGGCRGQAGEDAFMNHYQLGQQLYGLQQQLQRNDGELQRLEQVLRTVKTDEERANVRAQMRRLDTDQLRLRALITGMHLAAPR